MAGPVAVVLQVVVVVLVVVVGVLGLVRLAGGHPGGLPTAGGSDQRRG